MFFVVHELKETPVFVFDAFIVVDDRFIASYMYNFLCNLKKISNNNRRNIWKTLIKKLMDLLTCCKRYIFNS